MGVKGFSPDKGLTLKTSFLETLYGGQLTSSCIVSRRVIVAFEVKVILLAYLTNHTSSFVSIHLVFALFLNSQSLVFRSDLISIGD